ncbi:Glutamine-binding periplasmic protein precursor [Corynebacterium occultum]|uniref:Glutamine-binding periplasmic protein n=2 Tax=Corynebacterium occultum TaxID=2675219 RepID=A0A6B8W3X6_9CORY|nr:Glutamine-binding periplasmic protein precursor [Corynebacterium occultum]
MGAIITSAMVLSACVTNVEEGNPEGWEAIVPAEVPEISALVPDEIAARGELTMGTNPPFAPFEFKDSDGSIIGMEVDLARAAAGVLGLELRPVEQDFAMILPAVSASTLDFGGSGFTDTEERRENYDFINFLYAGVQWAQQPGDNIDPDNACGLSVAVQRTTVSETDDVRPKSEDCIAQGKEPIEVLSYDSSDTAATALVLGRADAFSADSPITAWAVERSEGRMELTGEMFQAAPYGYAFTKNSELGYAFAQALQYLIESGDYADVLAQWNIEEGLLDQALINEAPIPAATDYLNP